MKPNFFLKKLISYAIVTATIVGNLGIISEAAPKVNVAANHAVYNNNQLRQTDKGFEYTSVDKRVTGKAKYKTNGMTIHLADKNGKMSENEYIYLPFAQNSDNTPGSGTTVNTTKISNEQIKKACQEQHPDNWQKYYDAITKNASTVYANAVMNTYHNEGTKDNPIWVKDDGTYTWRDIQALINRYGWADPTGILSHFFKLLHRGSGDGDGEEGDPVSHSSGFEADYYTSHYDGTYDIGEGIPSGKTLTNAASAYGWEGEYAWVYSGLLEREYSVNYDVYYNYKTKHEYLEGDEVKTYESEHTGMVSGEEPVMRSASYYAICEVDIRKLYEVEVENGAYGSTKYQPSPNVTAHCSINGEKLTTYQPEYLPDDDIHIQWPAEPKTIRIYVPGYKHEGYSFSEAAEEFGLGEKSDDEGIPPMSGYVADDVVGPVEAFNDELWVETPKGKHVYLTKGEGLEDNSTSGRRISQKVSRDVKNAKLLQDMSFDGYVIEEDQMTKGVQIPISTLNGKYDTTLTATYIRIMAHDDNKEEKEKKASSTTENSKDHPIGRVTDGGNEDTGFRDENEPIVVHTPVISPVSLYDNTGKISEDHKSNESTQVVQPTQDGKSVKWNKELTDKGIESYNLLLDGTYTLNFEPYKWLDSDNGSASSEAGKNQAADNLNNDSTREGNRSSTYDSTKDPVSIDNPDGKDGYDLPGYGESGKPSKYDEFISQRRVRFPFDVAIVNNGSDNGEKYYSAVNEDQGQKWTEWITLKDNKCQFYIPTWAVESSEKFGVNAIAKYNAASNSYGDNFYCIQFDVEAYNATGEETDGEDMNNSDLNKYHATFQIPVNVSGIIYDFQILGVNDRDMFYGYSNDLNESVEYAFSPFKEEKKSGNKNRFGTDSIRQTLDGLLRKGWDTSNILPLSKGKSNAYKSMGTLWKGSRFSWSVKTIANLSDKNDYIKIRPRFRYIDANGNTLDNDGDITNDYDDIKLYYTDDTGKFIQYLDDTIAAKANSNAVNEGGRIYPNSTKYDNSEQYNRYMRDVNNVKSFTFSDEQFYGAWYEGTTYLEGTTFYPKDQQAYNINKYTDKFPDDLAYTIKQMILDGGSLEYATDAAAQIKDKLAKTPRDADGKILQAISENQQLKDSWKKSQKYAYSMSDITATSAMRILSGNCDFLERNKNYISTDNNYDVMKKAVFSDGTNAIPAKDSEAFRSSMQTWYGQYQIPEKLYVCKSVIDFKITKPDGSTETVTARLDSKKGESGYNEKADIDKNGVIDIYDYADTNELSDNSDIWLKDGYLVLNFDITAYNYYTNAKKKTSNEAVLKYKAGVGAEYTNMWDKQGYPDETPVDYEDPSDDTKKKTEETPLNDGDIAIIDLRYSLTDKYRANLFMVN